MLRKHEAIVLSSDDEAGRDENDNFADCAISSRKGKERKAKQPTTYYGSDESSFGEEKELIPNNNGAGQRRKTGRGRKCAA